MPIAARGAALGKLVETVDRWALTVSGTSTVRDSSLAPPTPSEGAVVEDVPTQRRRLAIVWLAAGSAVAAMVP